MTKTNLNIFQCMTRGMTGSVTPYLYGAHDLLVIKIHSSDSKQWSLTMPRKITQIICVLALTLPSMGCQSFGRNETSWYKPPNIISRDSLQGVTEAKRPTYLARLNPVSASVTHINPWRYEARVAIDTKHPPTIESRCLYAEILRLEAIGELDRATMYRNMLQDAIIGISNTVGSAHVATILGVEDALNLTTGFLDIVFDAVAVMVTPPGTKTIFAGLSGVAGATRSLINEEIYTNIIAPAILKAIAAERATEWERIVPLRQKNIREYNVEQAIADAIAYHEAWGFYRGLQRLSSEAQTRLTQQTESTQEQINRILGIESANAKTQRLLNEISKLPPATQTAIFTTVGTQVAGASFMTGVPAITDITTYKNAYGVIQDPSNQQTMADRLEGAYLVHRP